MSRTKTAGEKIKTGLIVLLSASALLLGWQTRLFNEFVSNISFFGNVAELMKGASGTVDSGGASLKEAARPVTIMITSGEGERYVVKYDTDARNAAYDRVSSIVGEAFGSAFAWSEISEDEWRSALSDPGVYFEYMTPVKLSVLDGWLYARMPESVADTLLRRVAVATAENRSRIYYQDDESGLFYGADTQLAAGRAQELEIYSENGAVFAFESGIAGSENAPYMLLMPNTEHPNLRAAAAGSTEDLLDAALAALGYGNEKYTTFSEGEGVLRRVGTQFNIGADLFGRIMYRNTENLQPTEEQRTINESQMIEQARAIISDTIGSMCGSAEVFFDSIEYSARQSVSLYFAYHIAGGRIHLFEDGYAAKVSIVSGIITEVELNFRNYSLNGEYIKLLPERQALAAAGGEFVLCYSDTGSERLLPSWIRY